MSVKIPLRAYRGDRGWPDPYVLYHGGLDTVANAPVNDHPAQRVTCMEIWGGNRAVDTAVSVPGIDAWVYSRPFGNSVAGGDIHYVSVCGGGRISRFAVADVSGHGEPVGRLAATLRSLMRKYINTLDQTKFIRSLNAEFSDLSEDGVFATALLTTYFAPTDQLIVCNAGHPPPLWYRAADKTWRQLVYEMPGRVASRANLPLGVIEPTSYHQFAVQLALDDLVLIFTDSLIETKDPAGRMLGEQGLLDLVRRLDPLDPARFCRSLLDALSGYRKDGVYEDDLTALLLHHNAADPPRHSIGEMITVIGKLLGLIRV